MVQADLERLHVVDDRLDLHRRGDRDDRGRRRRLAGRPASDLDLAPVRGFAADAGFTFTKGGAQNALLLGTILIVITTIINMLGVKLMSRINNFGVLAELIGSSILIILLLFHIHQSPAVIFHSYGYGAGHPWGYFGALLIGGLLSAYVMYGFDTAGTLGEETNAPANTRRPRSSGRSQPPRSSVVP